jgi:putative heme transporter
MSTNSPPPATRPVPARTIGGVSLGAIWKWARWVLGLGLAGVAIWAVEGRTGELSGASSYLAHLRWGWVVLAAVAEVLSYVSFAALQGQLLNAGETSAGIGTLSGITFAGNAIQNSLPAGAVLAAAFAYRQYRRYGADEVLAGWVILATAALAGISLAGLAAAGLAVAASRGNAYDLASVIIGVAVLAGLLVLAWFKREFFIFHSARVIRLSQRLIHRPHGDPQTVIADAVARLAAVAPNRNQWLVATGYAAGNWVLDCLCLILALLAVGAPIPWGGLLLAYTAAQLATNLPITPGGLGVVEGSMTVALVAFGGGQESTVAAVLLYRILNFWLLLPVGWGAWAGITFRHRHTPLPKVAP